MFEAMVKTWDNYKNKNKTKQKQKSNKKANKMIQNARQTSKMDAIELKIGQISPKHTLELKLKAVVVIDCM